MHGLGFFFVLRLWQCLVFSFKMADMGICFGLGDCCVDWVAEDWESMGVGMVGTSGELAVLCVEEEGRMTRELIVCSGPVRGI